MSLVRPRLENCSSIWNLYHQEYKNKLESVQCRAVRFVFKDFGCQSHVSDMLRDLNWKTLEDRRTISRLNNNNNNGYFLVLFLRRAHSPFNNKKTITV